MDATRIAQLQQETEGLNVADQLRVLIRHAGDRVAFSLGFGKEGMVLADHIFRNELSVRVFTLDTGRLFTETYELFDLVVRRYKRPIQVYFPNGTSVEKMVSTKGPTSFYDSVENRLECCEIRKVRPLDRALRGAQIWITGLRAGQSDFRKNASRFQWDERRKLIKFNPLLDWSTEEVEAYIKAHNVPVNQLHRKGFASIGCAPCTRALQAGEGPRDGRWWWEQSHKECGLHLSSVNAG